MKISHVATVGVPVADQDRALEFYLGTLGFEKQYDMTLGGGMRWLVVAPAGAATSIALELATEDRAPGVDTGIRLVTGDAAADHAELESRGVDVDPEVLRWPGVPPMFAFRDQDGNRLVLVEA
ncbi:MAG TPA: VOC family protein [Amycolatopsis sp.]|nr:VOC family protein [Amycolatopsis sp.]